MCQRRGEEEGESWWRNAEQRGRQRESRGRSFRSAPSLCLSLPILLAFLLLLHLIAPAYSQALYFTGDFHKFVKPSGEVVNVSGVAEWFEGGPVALGQGIALPAEGRTLDYSSRKAGLYIGGSFNQANGESVSRLTLVREEQMEEVDKGVSHTVYAAKVHEASGSVYVGGVFFDATGIPVGHITFWNGSSWGEMAGGVRMPKLCLPGGELLEVREAAVYALAIAEGSSPLHPRVYVGGRFMEAGHVQAHHIAVFDHETQAWAALCREEPPTRCDAFGIGHGRTSQGLVGPLEYVFALALHPPTDRLFVGGVFGAAGQRYASIQSLAVYNISSGAWGLVGGGIAGTNPTVNALMLRNGRLYVGGFFSTVGKQNEDLFVTGVTSPNIAAFNLETGAWEALGGGLPGNIVNALAVGSDGRLYVGGGFTSVTDSNGNAQPAAGLALFENGAWSPYGGRIESESGGPGTVYALMVIDARLPDVKPARVFTGTAARLAAFQVGVWLLVGGGLVATMAR